MPTVGTEAHDLKADDRPGSHYWDSKRSWAPINAGRALHHAKIGGPIGTTLALLVLVASEDEVGPGVPCETSPALVGAESIPSVSD
jgi:hypothetical protein